MPNRVQLITTLFAIGLTLTAPTIAALGADAVPGSFIALAYHNIEDSDPDQTFVGITAAKLVAQLSWLQGNGYHPVTIDALIAARDGVTPLPDKAVLLTFDDGYESFYSRAMPILRAFKYPAVLALVGAWMEETPDGQVTYTRDPVLTKGRHNATVQYGTSRISRDQFLTWDQVRAIAASGLVEIASHSYDAHRGVPADPQGNSEPDITTRRFDPIAGRYETDIKERQSLASDSARMEAKIKAETGKMPRVMVWPYGEHNALAISVARAHGMPITLALEDGTATIDRLSDVPRQLVTPDPDLGSFVTELRAINARLPIRTIKVELDNVYDADPVVQERNVDRLVQRVYGMQISTVFLKAFADPDKSGVARALYFPNRLLPMRADLFNHVSWQLRTRAHVGVFAWLPMLAFDFGDNAAQVQCWEPPSAQPGQNGVIARLSPFDGESRRKILSLYEDLARYTPFEGLFFAEDATLAETEDASPPALAAYRLAGLPDTLDALRADPSLWRRWQRFKTEALIEFGSELAARAQLYVTPMLTIRSLQAAALRDGSQCCAQDFTRFLDSYDDVALSAAPAMAGDAGQYVGLQSLVAQVAGHENGLAKTIFDLPVVATSRTADGNIAASDRLVAEMRLLLRHHALNFGYDGDDMVENRPDADRLHPVFSLQSYPALP